MLDQAGRRLKAIAAAASGTTIQATKTTAPTNDDIARRLVVAPLTAKTHINRAMMKLGARDRAQLVVQAFQSGLVRPDPR